MMDGYKILEDALKAAGVAPDQLPELVDAIRVFCETKDTGPLEALAGEAAEDKEPPPELDQPAEKKPSPFSPGLRGKEEAAVDRAMNPKKKFPFGG